MRGICLIRKLGLSLKLSRATAAVVPWRVDSSVKTTGRSVEGGQQCPKRSVVPKTTGCSENDRFFCENELNNWSFSKTTGRVLDLQTTGRFVCSTGRFVEKTGFLAQNDRFFMLIWCERQVHK